ncbi:MAG: VCBS repeat-containing protein [Chloroflexi bacterium]|nr:VCBS repeat-containing protein [Chloroflexota bacterium]
MNPKVHVQPSDSVGPTSKIRSRFWQIWIRFRLLKAWLERILSRLRMLSRLRGRSARSQRIYRRIMRAGMALMLSFSMLAPLTSPAQAAGADFTEWSGEGNPFYHVDVGAASAPSFVDIDGDGDMDAFVGEWNDNILYYKNTGTPLAPFFAVQTGGANPFDGEDVGSYSTPSFVDVDKDGDMDAFIGESGGNINYYKNTGTPLVPAFTEQTGIANPLNVTVGLRSAPSFVDVDGDGDMDAFIGEYDGNINFYKNDGDARTPTFNLTTGAADDPFDGEDVGFYSTPSFVDVDKDGDMDAFIGALDGNTYYYKNTGDARIPAFTLTTGAADDPFDTVSVGSYSAPSFVDVDKDGDMDAFIGASNGEINYYQNTDTDLAPAFTEQTGGNNPLNVTVPNWSSPSFVDVDGDGDMDAFVGNYNGGISYFQNTGDARNPAFSGSASPLGGVTDRSTPTFVDVDGDGDMDAFIGEKNGNINYYENTGTPLAPSFTLQTGAANPLNVNGGKYSAPSFVDVDGDGDMDAFIGVENGTINYYQNTGDARTPAFTAQTGSANPFNGESVGVRANPNFVDVDGDGDMDAFVGEWTGEVNYYENTGTPLAPAFTEQTGAANPLNVVVGDISKPSFVDVDADGDMDAFIGENFGTIKYYENTGVNTVVPNFVAQTGNPNPFAGVDVGNNSAPSFVDVDGDGDRDAFTGKHDGNINYYQNIGTPLVPHFIVQTGSANPFDGEDVGGDSAPSFVDVDGDGDMDAFIGEFDGTINYYRNDGTPLAPIFIVQTGGTNPFAGVDVGDYSTPIFVDVDGDGDMDAFIGKYDGNINYYRNDGTPLAPVFAAQTGTANPFDGEAVEGYSTPSFVDVDRDGDMDAFIGDLVGNLNFYQNDGTPLAPVFAAQTGSANPFNTVDVGANSTPSFVDVDGDGDMDAFIGADNGNLNYYQNTGANTISGYGFVAQTGTANPLNDVAVGYFSVPRFVDVDGDGDMDAFIGASDGTLNYYQNTGTPLAPIFTAQTGSANPLNAVAVGYSSVPSFVDVDGDGDIDAFIGEYDGNINYYKNDGDARTPAFILTTGSANPFDAEDVGSYSAPSFVDVDGDGDMDAFIGASDGTLNYYQNTGDARNPAFTEQTGTDNPLDIVSVVSRSIPGFMDVEGDGDMDAFVGASNGNTYYYRNTGTLLAPAFTSSPSPLNVDVGFYSAPSFVDVDADGDLDAFIGEVRGTLKYYENTHCSFSIENSGALAVGDVFHFGNGNSRITVKVNSLFNPRPHRYHRNLQRQRPRRRYCQHDRGRLLEHHTQRRCGRHHPLLSRLDHALQEPGLG